MVRALQLNLPLGERGARGGWRYLGSLSHLGKSRVWPSF